MTVELYCGDCLDVLPQLDADSIDTCVTDPPYGLEFMGKDWDHGIPGVRFWQEVCRVLKPGGFLLAFGGTRTWHRLACAIEDAGFELRDTVMWVYGSGFPKSHDISKAIDATLLRGGSDTRRMKETNEHDRVKVGERTDPDRNNGFMRETNGQKVIPITKGATDAAAQWDGWGTALKPAFEPIIVAMKPRDGTFANNALTWGVAGLAIDKARVATGDCLNGGAYANNSTWRNDGWGMQRGMAGDYQQPSGRWPANLVLSHAPGCRRVGTRQVKGTAPTYKRSVGGKRNLYSKGLGEYPAGYITHGYADADSYETIEAWDCVPDCPVRMLDEQSGDNTGAHGRSNQLYPRRVFLGAMEGDDGPIERDTGGASRFFVNLPPDACRFFYCAKAGRSERNAGLEEFEERVRPITCGHGLGPINTSKGDGTGLRVNKPTANHHPTVKPLALMRYLIRLTATPTGGVVLDPFAGSGTTGCACVLEGRDFIGIEQEEEYHVIQEARIAYWQVEAAQMQPHLEGLA